MKNWLRKNFWDGYTLFEKNLYGIYGAIADCRILHYARQLAEYCCRSCRCCVCGYVCKG